MPRKKSVVEEPIPSGENIEALEAEAAVETQGGDLPGGEPLNPEGLEPSREDGYPFAEEELESPQQEGFSEEAPPEIPVQEETSFSAESEEGTASSPEVPSAPPEAEPEEVPAAGEEAPAPAQEPPAPPHPPEEPEKPDRPPRVPSFFDLNYNQLDRDLSPEERQEWNSIYASYRSRSLLTGEIIGVDEHSFTVRDKTTGEVERKTVQCAIVIAYRVKVLIPETDMWFSSTEARPGFVLRNMVGAKIDYVILQVDREGGIAVASRRMALGARRYQLTRLSALHRPDALTQCRVLSVGPRRCLVECHGYSRLYPAGAVDTFLSGNRYLERKSESPLR